MKFQLSVFILPLFLGGCGESLIQQLSRDNASACGYTTVAYGAGAIMPAPTIPVIGTYVHTRFCRSNEPGSEIEVKPDGTLKIKHGTDKPTVVFVLPPGSDPLPQIPLFPPLKKGDQGGFLPPLIKGDERGIRAGEGTGEGNLRSEPPLEP